MGFISPLKTGLYIGKDYLSFSILKSNGRNYQIVNSAVIPLTKNSVRHSPIESNILNADEIKGHLKKVLLDFPKIKSISLSLPDLSSRMILIEIKDGIPPLDELNQMIKWNMEQKFIMKIGESCYSHQLISQSRQVIKRESGKNGSKNIYNLLGIAILKNILAEYENAPVSLHRIPKMINCASLNLFNLYHDLIFKKWPAGNFLFLSVLDNYFTLMVYEKGTLQYIRTVGMRQADNNVEEARDQTDENNRLKIINHIESVLPYHYQDLKSRAEIQILITGLPDLPKEIAEFAEHYRLTLALLFPEMVTSIDGVGTVNSVEMTKLLPSIAAAAGALN